MLVAWGSSPFSNPELVCPRATNHGGATGPNGIKGIITNPTQQGIVAATEQHVIALRAVEAVVTRLPSTPGYRPLRRRTARYPL